MIVRTIAQHPGPSGLAVERSGQSVGAGLAFAFLVGL